MLGFWKVRLEMILMSNLVVFLYATLDHDHGIITHGCTVSYSRGCTWD